MSGRTQFWLGSVMLALAMGLLVGRAVVPRAAHAQENLGEGRTRRYAMVTGLRGTAQHTQTVFIVDDVNQIIFAIEYHSRSNEFTLRKMADVRKVTAKLAELRDRAERRRPPE